MLPIKPLFAAVTAFAVLAGCQHSQTAPGVLTLSGLGRISVGMPKETAVKLLGAPETAATRQLMYQDDWTAHELLRYRMPGNTNYFVVVFRDGAITEYGPVVGERSGELEGLFEEIPVTPEASPDTAQPSAVRP